jgi:SAM-dependent methyltransferase
VSRTVTDPAIGDPTGSLAPLRMAARYDAVADTYASTADNYRGSAVATLLELVGPDPGPRVLDVACGHAPVARELARRGADVIGVDISNELLNRARSWVDGVSPDIEYVAGDATDPTLLAGEEFDLVVCNFGLSDIDDLDNACATVARLLVAGGRFVFSILHPCFAGADDVSGSWPAGRSYYDEGFWRAEGQRSVLRRQVGANHRMLSTYINTLVVSGLAVDVVVEPPPESDWAAERPGAGVQPVYLVVQCTRA